MILLALITILTFSTQPEPSGNDVWHFGNYILERSSRTVGSSGYRILQGTQEVYGSYPAGFSIVSVEGGKQVNPPEPTVSDITGDGVPDLIIEEHPRNPGCCFSYAILSLGPKFQEISHLTGFRSPMTFEDLNGDRVYEITGEDWTFASNYASPRIVLSHQKGTYQLSINQMKRTPPTRARLQALAKELAAATPIPGRSLSAEAYARVVNMIYEGNAHSALRLVDMVWPESHPGLDDFKKDLVSELEKSPYWPEVRSVNGNAFDGIR